MLGRNDCQFSHILVFLVRVGGDDNDNVTIVPDDADEEDEDQEPLVAYVVNSLVDIDGGTGNDRAIVVGTEANDKYVVTDGQIFGGGLVIKFAK